MEIALDIPTNGWRYRYILLLIIFFLLQNDSSNGTYSITMEIIDSIDIATVAFFTLEYFIRLGVCPNKVLPEKGKIRLLNILFQRLFFFNLMNAIDFIVLIPFYISMLLEGLEDVEIVGKAGKMVRFLKILRIFRVYKMFKHFAGLQSLLYTLQQAYKELGLLLHIVGETFYLHFS